MDEEINTSGRNHGIYIYYGIWGLFIVISTILTILNVRWDETNITLGVIYVLTVILLQSSALEFLMQTAITLRYAGKNRDKPKRAPSNGLTVILNYNLLATTTDDIDECMKTMYEAYMGRFYVRDVVIFIRYLAGKSWNFPV